MWLILAALLMLTSLEPVKAPNLCAPPSDAPTAEERVAVRQQRLAEMEAAVKAHLASRAPGPASKALAGLPTCITVRPVPGDGSGAVIDLELNGIKQWGERLVWDDGGAWRVQSLRADRWPELIMPVYAQRGELIAYAVSGGSGGMGRLQSYELDQTLRLLWESETSGDHLCAIPLDHNWVITIDRAPEAWEEPHAIMANCCVPADRERLWRHAGSAFEPVAQRIIPNPYRTASLFVGALRKGDRALAARFAANPELAGAGAALIGRLSTDPWEAERTWELQREEARHWEAIPPHLRGPAPAVTQVTWPSGDYELVTERTREGQWLVTAIRPAR